jgi:hypothetical protein
MKTFLPGDYQEAAKVFVLPLIAFVVFLGLWSYSAARIETSLGQVPGPVAVWGQAANLVEEHLAERQKEAAFFERQEKRNEEKLAEDADSVHRLSAGDSHRCAAGRIDRAEQQCLPLD